MKTLLGIASVIAFSVSPALAGEGRVSDQSLAKMGLSGMKAMSDSQGMHVRGLSVAVAGGASIAYINGVGGSAGSINYYYASGAHSASGVNVSTATDTTKTVTTYGFYVQTTTTTNTISAGGFSSASAGR